MKLLITGGTGFIGSHLLPLLHHHDVICLDRLTSPVTDSCRLKRITCDLSNPNHVADIFQAHKPDGCIHLAWQGLPDYSFENNLLNLNITLNLVSAAVKSHCKKIFIAGTCFEYADTNSLLHEDCVLPSRNQFGAFKRAIQLIAYSLTHETSTSLIWGRLFYVYGPGQRSTSLIPTVLQQLQAHQPLQIRTPQVSNDFIYVSDVARAILCLIDAKQVSGIYNIGSGKYTSAGEVANIAATLLKKRIPYPPVLIPSQQVISTHADITKLSNLGWSPEVSISEGVQNIINSCYLDS